MTKWILLAGLPATGKSTLARALAARLERSVILDKDRVREALFPGAITDYSSQQDELCFNTMLEAAAYMTRNQQADFIFFDGRTFSRAAQIQAVLSAAENANARWQILHLTCSDEAAEERLRHTGTDHPANNRNIDLYRSIQARFEPILFPKLDLETTGGVESLIGPVLDSLRI